MYLKKQFNIKNTEYFDNDPIPISKQTKEVQYYYYNYLRCKKEYHKTKVRTFTHKIIGRTCIQMNL